MQRPQSPRLVALCSQAEVGPAGCWPLAPSLSPQASKGARDLDVWGLQALCGAQDTKPYFIFSTTLGASAPHPCLR